MSFGFNDKIVELELTNLSSTESQSVELFNPNNFTNNQLSYSSSFSLVNLGTPGHPYTYLDILFLTSSIFDTNTNSLVSLEPTPVTIELFTETLSRETESIWEFESDGEGGYVVFSNNVSSLYSYVLFEGESTYPQIPVISYPIIPNSLVSVSMDEDYLTYPELTNELNGGYYVLTEVNVYAQTLTQVTKKFKINNIQSNSVANLEYQNPIIDPTQSQFVILNNPINYYVRPTSTLTYTLEPSATVKLIFRYKNLMKEPYKDEYSPEMPDVSFDRKVIDLEIDMPKYNPKKQSQKQFIQISETKFKPLQKLQVELNSDNEKAKDYAIRYYIDKKQQNGNSRT